MSSAYRPLVLVGGPAVGKTTTGRAIATARQRAAFVDGDDVRQLVVAGAAPLWSGPAGADQHALATRNIASLARNFRDDAYDTVVADFATPASLRIYRDELPDAFVVQLTMARPEARRRASSRRIFLTPDEFELLHDLAATPLPVDLVVDVTRMSLERQIETLRSAWLSESRR